MFCHKIVIIIILMCYIYVELLIKYIQLFHVFPKGVLSSECANALTCPLQFYYTLTISRAIAMLFDLCYFLSFELFNSIYYIDVFTAKCFIQF